jgi:hypothetical protein
MKFKLLLVVFSACFVLQVSGQTKTGKQTAKRPGVSKLDTSWKPRIGNLPDTARVKGLRQDTSRKVLPPPGSRKGKAHRPGSLGGVSKGTKPGIGIGVIDTTKFGQFPSQ